MHNSYSIIIPAYNEERRIAKTIIDLETNIPEIKEIIVVADGSDNTPTVAKKSGEKVTVLKFDRRLGKGGAVIEGFKMATGEVVCYIDADGSAPWYEVKKICSMVGIDTPAVVGSRWLKSSNVKRHEPLRRVIMGRLFHYVVFATLGIKTKDTQCGLKAFTYESARKLSERVQIKNWTFDVSILVHLKIMGITPVEVGIEWFHIDASKVNMVRVIPMMFMSIVGLRLRHSHNVSKKLKKTLEDLYESFNSF